ncbi:MAG: rod shape-determining protein RodA [Anaerolineae bacterium]|nr:rod shape-determining protein RodA [Anaerolineae bacterium]
MYSARRSAWAGFDFPLLAAVVVTSLFGLAMVHSAVRGSPGLEGSVQRQAVFLVVSLVLAVLVSTVDYRLLVGSSAILYGLGLASLLVVLVLGAIQHGGQRWIQVGGVTFQPSEVMKVILLLALAQYLGPRSDGPSRLHYLIVSGAITAVPLLLVYAQPDLGTAVVLLVIWAGAVFVAGVSLWQVGLLGVVGLAASPLIWLNLEDYMRDRVLALVRPDHNPQASFVVEQALIGIGSGSIWGKGYASGSQSQLHFLRVRHTDFIFSVIGEELGFVGAVMTMALLVFICWRLFGVAETAPDGAGRIIASGVAVMIAFQTLVNVGMNLGWLPVTGLPLPFISVGGSAVLAQFLGIGLAESVAAHRLAPS